LPTTGHYRSNKNNHLDLMIETTVGELFVISHDVDDVLLPGAPVWLSFASSGVILVP
jgi:iron(III) transport system ATP-binding protein